MEKFRGKLVWQKRRRKTRENKCRDLDEVGPWLEVGHGNFLGECSYSSFCSSIGPRLQTRQDTALIKYLAGKVHLTVDNHPTLSQTQI